MMLNSSKILRRDAFTLVELLVVITLVGLLSAITIVSTTEVASRARQEYSIERLISADVLLRSHGARRGMGGEMILELGTAQVKTRFGGSSDFRSFDLGNTRLLQIKTASRDIRASQHTIEYSPLGTTETYAIAFQRKSKPIWVVVAGETGEVTRFEEETDVDALFKTLAE